MSRIPTPSPEITIRLDTKELTQAINEVRERLSALSEPVDGLVEIVQGFLERPDVISSDLDDGLAVTTGDLTCSLKPGDGLRDLLAALRARDVESEFV